MSNRVNVPGRDVWGQRQSAGRVWVGALRVSGGAEARVGTTTALGIDDMNEAKMEEEAVDEVRSDLA